MFVEIFLNTIAAPLAIGVVLFVLMRKIAVPTAIIGLVVGLMLLAIFVLLEGWPSLPPISSKPKVAVLMCGFAVLSVLTMSLQSIRWIIVSGMLIAAMAWIGWNRISDIAMAPRFIALLAPILVGGWAFQNLKPQNASGLIWPITLISFAIGGALVSLSGAYIGFAQMMGALAAFVGGFALVAYLALLLRPADKAVILPRVALQVIFLGMMAVLIAVGMFAPEVSPLALAILALVLFAPLFEPRVAKFHPALRPIIIGAIAAAPVGISIILSTL